MNWQTGLDRPLWWDGVEWREVGRMGQGDVIPRQTKTGRMGDHPPPGSLFIFGPPSKFLQEFGDRWATAMLSKLTPP